MKALYRLVINNSHVADAHAKRASVPHNGREARNKKEIKRMGRKAVRRFLKEFT